MSLAGNAFGAFSNVRSDSRSVVPTLRLRIGGDKAACRLFPDRETNRDRIGPTSAPLRCAGQASFAGRPGAPAPDTRPGIRVVRTNKNRRIGANDNPTAILAR